MAPTIPVASSAGGNATNGTVPRHVVIPPHGYPVVNLRNNLTALMVDGDRICRVMEKGFLQLFGVETVDLDNGHALVEHIASGATYNLIFIDSDLPFLNGLEATRQIRAMGVRTKIVGMSARFRGVDIDEFMQAGADQVIEWPLLPEIAAPILQELDDQL